MNDPSIQDNEARPSADGRLSAFPLSSRALMGWVAAIVIMAVIASVVLPPSMNAWWHSGVFRGSGRSLVSRVQSDMRSLSLAIESYRIDHSVYPAWATGEHGVHAGLSADLPEYAIPTFAIRTPAAPRLYTLTTPIQYMTGWLPDPFSVRKRGTYGYWHSEDGSWWILFSPGPNLKYEIVPWEDCDPLNHPAPALINKTYDPTNGTISAGDIWRMGFADGR